MTPEEADKKLNQFRQMSVDVLKKNLAVGFWGSDRLPSPDRQMYDLANLALEEKLKEEEQIKFDKTIKAAQNLVYATWALVVITTILVLVTFLSP
jgi:hypothetical protein